MQNTFTRVNFKWLLIPIFLLMGTVTVNAQNLLTEGFEGSFPPAGWNTSVASPSSAIWKQISSGSSSCPTCSNAFYYESPYDYAVSAHSGTYMAYFNSYNYSNNYYGELKTPVLNFSTYSTSQGQYKVSFWMFRDPGYTSTYDNVEVYVTTNTSSNGQSLLGTINRYYNASPVEATSGWDQYSYYIPSSYSGPTNYIIFKGISQFGNNMFIDDVSVDFVPCKPAITSQPVNTSVCLGASTTLSVSAVATSLSYQWYRNGSPISSATNSTYTINSAASTDAGSYYVAVTGTCGTTNSNIVTVLVPNPPPATATAAGPTTFCANSSVAINANVGTGLNYQWKLNGSPIAANANGPVYTATQSGTYKVTVTNSNGCSATSSGVTVTTQPTPAVTLTTGSSPTFCVGDSVALNANTGSGIHYQWSDNGVSVGGDSANFIATQSGSYTVTETGSNGCTATFPTPVSVVVNGPSSATITPSGATTFCLGSYVTLNAPADSNYTYQWYQDGNLMSSVTGSAYTAAATGNYSVKITSNGCSLTSQNVPVTANSAPTSVSASGTIICTGNNVQLNAPLGPGTLTYLWKLGSANAPGANTGSTYTTNTPGTYSVIVNDGTCTDTSAPVVLTANTPPPAYITASGPTSFCPGGNVQLNANSGPSLTYQWQYNNANISSASNISYTADTTGDYRVIVSNGSCADTSAPVSATEIALPVPVISTSGTTSFCVGNTVTLSTALGAGLTYQWQRDGININTPSATTPTYVAGATGSYNVVVTNSTGCTDSAATPVQVTATAYPTAAISVSGSDTACSGTGVPLSAPAGSNYSYQWQLNDVPVSGATSSTYTASSSGNYKVSINNNGCADTSTARSITILPSPVSVINAGGSTTACSGDSVVLNATVTPGVSYQWIVSSTDIPGATNTSYTAYAAGNYQLRVTNNNGCSTTSTGTAVNIVPLPNANITSQGNTVCQGSTLQLTASAGPGYTYQWKRNGFNIIGATNMNYAAYQAGSYNVVVYDGTCNSMSSPVSLSVSALPSDTITVNGLPANTNGMVCSGGQVQLMVSSGSGYNYQWQVNGNDISGATNATYNATDSGTYSVVVTNGAGCVSVGHTPIYIGLFPEPNPTIIAYGLTLTTGSFNSYQWYRNNSAIPGATANSYQATLTGTYKVQVVDSNGCSQFSPDYDITYTGVNNVVAGTNVVHIYPNPTQGMVHIDAPVVVNVKVNSLDGKTVISKESVKDVDLSGLANGVYMITIYDNRDNSVIKIDKLVKSSW